jgi:hypothetical protein
LEGASDNMDVHFKGCILIIIILIILLLIVIILMILELTILCYLK